MSRKGRPSKCSSVLSEETREELRASAFTRRALYRRFLKDDTDMSERTFYRLMEGKPARKEYVAQVEDAMDRFIREPGTVLKRMSLSVMDPNASAIKLTRNEVLAVVPLLYALE